MEKLNEIAYEKIGIKKLISTYTRNDCLQTQLLLDYSNTSFFHKSFLRSLSKLAHGQNCLKILLEIEKLFYNSNPLGLGKSQFTPSGYTF